jgi:hypothetical protein
MNDVFRSGPVVIDLGTEVFVGHVVRRIKKPEHKADLCVAIATAIGKSGAEIAILLAELDNAGYEVRRKGDRL